MNKMQKFTTHKPVGLPREARAATGKGVTETIRVGLGLVATARAQDDLRRLRGKVRLGIDLKRLRKDRA